MNRIKTIGLTVLTIILTTAFTVTIDLETKSLLNDKVELKIPKDFVNTFEIRYPSAEWKDSGIKTINGKEVGYLELVTPAIDTEIYNLMFFTDLDGKLLLCTFNCTKKSIDEWTPTAKEIMNSLKIK